MNLVLNLADNSKQACSYGSGPCDIMTPKMKKKTIKTNTKKSSGKHILSSNNNWHVHMCTHIYVHTHSYYIF